MKKKCKEVTATNLKEKNKISMERGQLRGKLRRIFLNDGKKTIIENKIIIIIINQNPN